MKHSVKGQAAAATTTSLGYVISAAERAHGRLEPARKAAAYVSAVGTVGGYAVRLYRQSKARVAYTVTVRGSDVMYPEFQQWVLDQLPSTRRRSLTAATRRLGQYYDSTSSERVPVRISYNGEREHMLRIGDHRVHVRVFAAERQVVLLDRVSFNDEDKDRLIFTCYSAGGRDALTAKLQELTDAHFRKERKPNLRILTSYGDWLSRSDAPQRDLASVVLRAGQMDRIVADLDRFLSSEETYRRRSMPWHRGYLFYGPPGTGKTSLVQALAAHAGMDLWYLPLGDLDKDTKLIQAVSTVSRGGMLLLEDVDVFHTATARDESHGHASLSALLNSLDGLTTPHGLVTVLTTNRREVLDQAILRPGRVDFEEELGYLDTDQARRLIGRFYDQAPAVVKPSALDVTDKAVTPAQLTEVLKRHPDSPAGAAAAIRAAGWVGTIQQSQDGLQVVDATGQLA